MPRKKPYSGKQKKKQLKEKKDKKREGSQTRGNHEQWHTRSNRESSGEEHSSPVEDHSPHSSAHLHQQPNADQRANLMHDPNRYRLHFLRESRDEIDRKKLEAQTEIIIPVFAKDMEACIEDVYQPGSKLDMPQRPEWKYSMSKEKLEMREEEYFEKYLDDVHSKFGSKNLSYFEHNLETWRQLWRVLEMSDIIGMVADVRHPVLHFSPALYNYVIHTINKPLILILNKIDLVPASVVVAWRAYFMEKFPYLHVVCFSSFPKDMRRADVVKVKKRRPTGKRVYTTQIGPNELLQVCEEICKGKVDLKSWREKIREDLAMMRLEYGSEDGSRPEFNDSESSAGIARNRTLANENLFKNDIFTMGFVGHPNVGKSSLMNGLIGKKVVSTSVTPGHTKYFQTYYLTPTVVLCDCPGLVFPSLIDKQFQILSGIYPISQVQEPYTPVGYLAARIPIIKLLKLKHPDSEKPEDQSKKEWTAWDICEAWAEKRGFYTAKGARTDVYRAANHILRMAVDGRLCMYMTPPEYVKLQEFWNDHPETIKFLTLTSGIKNKRSGHTDDVLLLQKQLEHIFQKEVQHSSDLDSGSCDSDLEDEMGKGDGEHNEVSVGNKFSLLDDN